MAHDERKPPEPMRFPEPMGEHCGCRWCWFSGMMGTDTPSTIPDPDKLPRVPKRKKKPKIAVSLFDD